MIYVRPSNNFEAVVQGFPTGLAGTVGVQLIDNQGVVTIPRTTAGIIETPAGSGIYAVTMTAPVSEGQYTVVWDKGTIAPGNVATDEVVVSGTIATPGSGSVSTSRGSEPRLQYVSEQNPSITDIISQDGVAVDLTGKSVRFKMRAVGSTTAKVDQPISNTPGADGVVRYDWAAPDVDTAGFYLGWWEVTAAGKKQAKPEFLLEFRAHGPTAGWLVELVEVRQSAQLKEKVDEWDDRIIQLIPIATERIQTEIDRELVPTNGATRTRQSHGRLLDFSPYDLRSATSVVLDPNGQAKTLTANTDYKLLPSGSDRWGVYTELRISDYIAVDIAALRFGVIEVQVTGNWGFPSVPGIAKEACFDTIRAWLGIGASRAAHTDPDMPGAPDPALSWALPASARNKLMPLYRDKSSV